jgi:hypothetical protein
MKKLFFSSGLCVSLLLSACGGTGPTLDDLNRAASTVLNNDGSGLSSNEITQGLKEALTQGSNLVVAQLGQADGFNNDPRVHIPLPKNLLKARDIASKVGLQGSFDDLEERLNRAAERATPQAKELFLGAISDMSIDDAKSILQGPDNAATQYFRNKTGVSLESAMRPLVDDALNQVGAVRSFNSMMAKYKTIPLAPEVSADLSGHVVDKGIDGIFLYLAEEEKAIRENPLKRTSQLLQRVFGSQ